MQNNQLGSIALSNTKRPRAYFNKSADLHTTMDFGSVIPARCQRLIPNSKMTVQSSERMLLAPLVRPTMGRLSLKGYHNFVSMSDIWPNYAAMMAQGTIYRNGTSFVPSALPSVTVSELSLSILFGARLSVYLGNGSSGASYADMYDLPTSGSGFDPNDTSTWPTGQVNCVTAVSDLGILKNYSGYGLSSAVCVPAHILLGANTSVTYAYLPISNVSLGDVFNLDGTSDVVSFDNADVVLSVSVNSRYYYLCFRLSSFGKRLRKILIGCGYEINFNMSDRVSVLPLLAFYKSYFDVFGLTLYSNWESTACSRFITYSVNISNQTNLQINLFVRPSTSTLPVYFRDFLFQELGFCLYTDEQDFVSSHIRNTAVSPDPQNFINSINTDVDAGHSYAPNIGSGATQTSQPSDLTSPNGHAAINSVLHGQLDSELLKRLYRWTNRNTIAGRRIAELLRAQGLGSYVDECKSNFIGSFELPIDIYDVPSQSDTFSDAGGSPEGMRLGEYGARGIAQNQEKPFTFETSEDGYWITLFVVVPKGGYSEVFDPTVFALDKWSQYNPEFDSLGYEASRKALVQGSQPFGNDPSETSTLSDSFGYVPRYFAWKFGRNVINGDFSRRGSRSAYAPFMLEKLIDVGDREVTDINQGTGVVRTFLQELFKPSSLPIAGDVWRYPTRYPWIGQFNRIFYFEGDSRPQTLELSSYVTAFEFFSNQEDNFILHTVFNVSEYAPMLPVEDSFETYDDDNAVNGSMGKA